MNEGLDLDPGWVGINRGSITGTSRMGKGPIRRRNDMLEM